MMKQRVWVVLILTGAVVGNGVVYYLKRGRGQSSPTATAAPAPSASSVGASPAKGSEEGSTAGLVRARRAAGLAALEDGDFDAAVFELKEASKLIENKEDEGDVPELLRIARSMRERKLSRIREDPLPVVAAPAPSRAPAPKSSSRSSPPVRERRVASRHSSYEPPEPAEAPEQKLGGMLLVTSTPPGLVIQVDGKKMDLTPARLRVDAGSHRVVLMKGDQVLFQRTANVDDNGVETVDADVTAQLSPPPPAPREPEPAPAEPPQPMLASLGPTATQRGTIAPVTGGRVPEPERTPIPTTPLRNRAPDNAFIEDTQAPRPTGRGELQVTSPTLYGEVWINERAYGFPPVLARDVPAGTSHVEIRVHGEVKRKLSVNVAEGRRSILRVR